MSQENIRKGVIPASSKGTYSSAITEPFWEAARQGKFVCQQCTSCGTFRMPPAAFCFNCQSRESTFTELPGTAEIYTYTIVRHPLLPVLADVVPYVFAVVDLDGTQGHGARMLVNVIDCDVEKVKIGNKVKIQWEKVNEEYSVPRFVPVGW